MALRTRLLGRQGLSTCFIDIRCIVPACCDLQQVGHLYWIARLIMCARWISVYEYFAYVVYGYLHVCIYICMYVYLHVCIMYVYM